MNKQHIHTTISTSTKELLGSVLWLIVIILVLYGGLRVVGSNDIQRKIAEAGALAPFLLIAAKASTLVFAPLGGAPLYPLSGALFGFTKGFAYMFIGDFIGNSLSFFISRFFGKKIVRRFVLQSGIRIVDDILEHLKSWKGLFHARVMFIGMPELFSYAAGLSEVSFWRFTLSHTLIGTIPTAVLVFFGHALFIVRSPILIVGFGIASFLAVFLGVFLFSRTFRGKRQEPADEAQLPLSGM